MLATTDYAGFVLFFFENGRVAKVALSAYQTKTNRRRLVAAYSDKFPLAQILFIPEDTELLLRSTGGRMLLVHTGALAVKSTRDTQGVAVMTQKRGQRLAKVTPYVEGSLQKPHRYRTRTLPAAGSLPAAEDQGEQLTL